MFEIFGVPSTALFGQLLLGLINGSFYALLSICLLYTSQELRDDGGADATGVGAPRDDGPLAGQQSEQAFRPLDQGGCALVKQ